MQHNGGRYIRPIAVVAVERTGKDQRTGNESTPRTLGEYLVVRWGVPADARAVKSAEMDELAGNDLLSEFSPVRWIITRAALMEGWDCSFAYLLVMLDNTTAQRAITQLVAGCCASPTPSTLPWLGSTSATFTAGIPELAKPSNRCKEASKPEGMTGLSGEVQAETDDWVRVTVNRGRSSGAIMSSCPWSCTGTAMIGENWTTNGTSSPAIDWPALKLPAQQDSTPERPSAKGHG